MLSSLNSFHVLICSLPPEKKQIDRSDEWTISKQNPAACLSEFMT